MLKPSDPFFRNQLVEAAGHCVACGLCLPHCPTYRKSLNEADSPRGRIILMGAVLEGVLPVNSRFLAHLDQCLTCRACEAVCPNNVNYGHLVNQVRSAVEPLRRRNVPARFFRWLALEKILANPPGLILAASMLSVWQRAGGRVLARLAGKMGLSGLSKLAEALPGIPARVKWRASYSAEGVERGRVALFLGCVASVFDVETLAATVYVLNKLGYSVDVPSAQNCCGAVHAAQGDLKTAGALARGNARVFSGGSWDAVIVTASGCAAALSDYPQRMGGESLSFSCRIAEIAEFLSMSESWRDIEILPLRAGVAVHEPCSLRNVLQGRPALYRMLQRIPDVELIELEGNDQCCGAGGAYRLTQPEMSDMLLADKLTAIEASGARIVVSSNIGCALHLAEGARRAGLEVEVLHPIVLLARQMGYGG